MKLQYHKINLTGHWLRDNEIDDNYTEKAPPNNGYQWNEDLNEWELIPEPEAEPEPVVTQEPEDPATDI